MSKHILLKLFRRKSIRNWFVLPSSLQMLLTISLILLFIWQVIHHSSGLIIDTIQRQMMHQVDNQITNRLQSAMQLNQISHDSLQHGILDMTSPKEREHFFASHLQAYPEVAMNYIGMADGSAYGALRLDTGEVLVTRTDSGTGGESWYYPIDAIASVEAIKLIGFDARTRPWYRQALETGEPAFSGVYSHLLWREPTITAFHPAYDRSGEVIGVFGIDYPLLSLGEMFNSLPTGEAGQVFMIDHAGMLIATSWDSPTYTLKGEVPQLLPAAESENAIVKAALTLLPCSDRCDSVRLPVEGKYYYARHMHYREYGNDWTIFVVLAEDDFLGDVKHALLQTMIFLLGAFLLSVAMSFWIYGKITKPITNLSKAAEQLSKGVFIPAEQDESDDEIGRLSRSFNRMGQQLTDMVARLEAEVAIRTQELQSRNEELKRLSFSDGLTGIANRRLFDESFAGAWNAALRGQKPLALLLFDIDFFKHYNDTYGHQAGDDCLKAIGAQLAAKARRATDLAARYGGEEFVLLIPEAEPGSLLAFAEEIRQSIEALMIEHKASPFGHVTVSVGAAYQIPTADSSAAALIEAADHAMYRAKESGRNRVLMEHPRVC